MQLSQQIGNRRFGQFIQAKLRVSQPADEFEQEADRVADRVMRMPDETAAPVAIGGADPGSQLQRACSKCEADDEEIAIQRQAADESEELTLQPKGKAGATSDASPAVAAHIEGLGGSSQPLSATARTFFEPRFGYDFSQVRVHTNAAAAESASAVKARAFTVNRDIVFGAGEYNPQTESGRRLLSHELTHVVQQQAGGSLRGEGRAYEGDADHLGSRVAARQSSEDAGAMVLEPLRAPTPLRTIQREAAADAKTVARSLTNPLFAGDAELQSVLDGKKTLSSGNGKHIYKVQTALINLGYELPIFGADSGFGKELASALGQFQNDNGIAVTEALDAATMEALDKKAPAAALTKYPEYAKLLGDGLLDFTVGVGYDEDGNFDVEIEPPAGEADKKHAIVPELKKLGFAEKKAEDAEKVYAKAGMKMPDTAGGRYFIWPAALKYGDKDIDVIVRLLTYKDPEVRKAFLEAMQKSDVAIYTGHGRYGSGPDFDPKTKGGGNILINPDPTVKDPGTLHMYDELKKQGVKQPLPTMSFDQKYKIWFFDGCNTKHYMPSIRKLAKVDTKKTDVFAWGQEIAIDTTGEDIVSFVNGLVKMQSAKDLIDNLNKINKIDTTKPEKGAGGEGLGDNPESK